MKSLRVAVIGAGYWGPNLVRNLNEAPGADPVAVADLSDERLETIHKRFPAVHTTKEYRELFADPWLDEEPEWVQSVGACYTQPDIEDVVFLTMGFPSGAVAHAHLSWLAPSKLRSMVVIGSHRMAVYDDVQSTEKVKIYDHGVTELSSEELRRSYRSGDIRSPHIAGTEALQMEMRHF